METSNGNHTNSSTPVLVCQAFNWKNLCHRIAFCEKEGLRYIPLWWGKKKPSIPKWKPYQTTAPTNEEKASWFHEDKPSNIAALCGSASNGLIALDFNTPDGGIEFFGEEQWQKVLESTFVIKTARGHRVLLRTDAPQGNEYWNKDDTNAWLEIKGEGSYCLLPPSLHDTGVFYESIGAECVVKPKNNYMATIHQRIEALGLKTQGKQESSKGERPKEKKPHWATEALRGVDKGSRQTTAARLVGYFRQRLPEDITLSLMEDWGQRCNPPCQGNDDPVNIKQTVSSIYSQYSEHKTLDIISLPTLLNGSMDNPGELVSGILPTAGVCVIAGEPGTGKTWLILTLARDVSQGNTFLNRFATEQGTVLIIDEESGKHRLHKRILRLGMPPELPILLSIMKVVNLSDPDWINAFRQEIEDKKPRLVVMDSLVRMHRGDENTASEMAKLFSALTQLREEFGCSFLLTHHLRKRSQQRSLNTLEQRLRGSSDIAAYADTILGLDKVDKRIVLSQLKNRDGEFFKPLALGIDDVEDDRTEVVVLAEVDEEADKLKLARGIIRQTLKEKSALREELVSLAKAEGISERTMADSLKSLIDAGEVSRQPEGRKTRYEIKNDPKITTHATDAVYI